MARMKLTFGLLAMFGTAAWGAGYTTSARPGTINYVEGQVRMDGQKLGASDMGKLEVGTGHVLDTRSGKAEILLTPGAFLRIGDHSSVRMVNPGLTDTRVQVLQGRAMVEVTDLYKDNNILVADNGATTRIRKNGLYEFDADAGKIAVYDGKATVNDNDREVNLKKGKELTVSGPLKAQSFDRTASEDDLYRWSNTRSAYLSEATLATARTYVVNPGYGPWFGTGWYWNPWYSTWAFMPGDGLFYSPFGYGFFSPSYYYYYRPPVAFIRGGGHIGRVGSTGVRGVVPRTVAGSRGMAAPRMSMGAPRMSMGGSRIGRH